ncbi:MAG: DNA-binding transcriptional regulator, XRE-family domain, partial [Mucilaginibacter sp.]|nr:DNA-binding transcriptional regulator, XRE-family domain [Mucilaginibacter sp.]
MQGFVYKLKIIKKPIIHSQSFPLANKIQSLDNFVIRYNLYYYETMKKIDIPYTEIKIKLKLITDNIRKLRESRNYSQEYMAGRLYISQNTY